MSNNIKFTLEAVDKAGAVIEKNAEYWRKLATDATKAGSSMEGIGASIDQMVGQLRAATPANAELAASAGKLWDQFEKGEVSAEEAADGLEKLKQAADQTNNALDKTGKSAGGMRDAFGKLNGAVGGAVENITGLSMAQFGAVGAITAFAGALKYSVQAAMDAEKANKQLEQVIASTGGAAGMSVDQINDMVSSLSMLTATDDDLIKTASSVMLTFTKIGQEVFPQAMEAALNVSAALGQDLQSSVIQLGKALNDPVEGISALSRVGVSFTDTQKEMIKSMVEAGDTMGAQKIILAELNTEFGGQAAAAADTYAGKLATLQIVVDELAGSVGEKLLPVLSRAATAMLAATTGPQKLNKLFGEHSEVMGTAAGSWDEYVGELQRSGEVAGLVVRETENGIKVFDKTSRGLMDVTDQYDLLTRAQMDTAHATKGATAWGDRYTAMAQAQTKATFEALGAQEYYNYSLDATKQYYAAAEGSARAAAKATADYGASLDVGLAAILSGKFGQAQEDFALQQDAIKAKIDETKAKITELSALPYATASQKEQLVGLQDELGNLQTSLGDTAAAYEENMKRMAFTELYNAAKESGSEFTLTEKQNLVELGQAWGIYDETTASVLGNINANIGALDTDTPGAFLATLEDILGLPTSQAFDYTVSVNGIEAMERLLELQRQLGNTAGQGAQMNSGLNSEMDRAGYGGSGARAAGGPVTAGGSYLVGESAFTRPEIFVPSQNGYVLTKQDAQAALSGAGEPQGMAVGYGQQGGGGGINITIAGNIVVNANNPNDFANQLAAMGKQSRWTKASGGAYQGG